MTRNERRGAKKDTQTYYLRRGIRLNDLTTLVFLTRRLIKILANKNNKFRASDTAKEAQAAFKRTLAQGMPATACAKGCSHCCKSYFVSACPPDIFRIARHIRDNHKADFEAELDRICAAENNTRNVSHTARYNERLPCSLLIDDACSVYEARPTACRGWASTDVKACENREDDIPVPEVYRESRRAIDHAVRATLKHHGRDKRSFELNHAVRVALEDPDSEARWLNGEDVFKDVQVDQSVRDPDKMAVGEQFMDRLIYLASEKPVKDPVAGF